MRNLSIHLATWNVLFCLVWGTWPQNLSYRIGKWGREKLISSKRHSAKKTHNHCLIVWFLRKFAFFLGAVTRNSSSSKSTATPYIVESSSSFCYLLFMFVDRHFCENAKNFREIRTYTNVYNIQQTYSKFVDHQFYFCHFHVTILQYNRRIST